MGSKSRSTRRQFLKGEAALDALQGTAWKEASADSPLSRPPNAQRTREGAAVLVQVGRRAMACDFQIFCDPGQYPRAVDAATDALDLIDRLEDQMTVYREHSEIMHINRAAHRAPVVVESRLAALLQRCLEWSRESGGAFDITASPLIKLWGFYTRRGRFPESEEIAAALDKVGSQFVELDAAQASIHFRKPGVELNLGSVGKGYALDRCAELLDAAGVASFLIHGGHSSILARGARRKSVAAQEATPWSVALRHPLRPERRLVELKLSDQGLGTSGSGQQFFYHRGRRYGHVLDPRSGMPAEGILSATVLAPSATQADALATMFFVLGIEASAAYCEQHPELSVVFVVPGTRQGTVAIESINAAELLQEFDSK